MTDQTTVDAITVDPTPARRNRLRGALLAGALLAAVTIGLADAAPAFAHDELLGSSPEHGEVLDDAPAAIELEFSNDIIEMGTAVIVVDAVGEELEVEEPVISGRTVTATLPTGVADGEYQARWRAVSADGHPIEGTIDFGVGSDASGEYPVNGDDAEHADDAEHDADAEHDTDEASAASDADPTIGIIVGVAAVLAAIALVVALIVRTRRRGDAS
ncbi:copper resistance CopC family protein [Agromyces sp. NPDC049794]|uniref:copper resistance CopC family protein n=1 Tax=unclassified Agromyces TaxID=2639701 RepID=UPI003409E091